MMNPAPNYRTVAARSSGKADSFGDGSPVRSGAHARSSLKNEILETIFLETAMIPLCPNCSRPMSTAQTARNAYVCTPCRELIQFFNVGAKEDHTERFRAGVILEMQSTGVGV
jgi:hypothetical protein